MSLTRIVTPLDQTSPKTKTPLLLRIFSEKTLIKILGQDDFGGLETLLLITGVLAAATSIFAVIFLFLPVWSLWWKILAGIAVVSWLIYCAVGVLSRAIYKALK